jgi:PAS domain S-box-containing protein
METHAVPLTLPGGGVAQLAVTRDVTQRKEVERVQAMLAAIVESSEDAIYAVDLHGTIESWNGGARRLYGYESAEAVGRPMRLLLPPDRVEEEREMVARMLRGERVEHFETVRVAKDGRRIDVSLTVSPVRDDGGRIVGASKTARDISRRRHAEQALQKSERELREFVENATVGIHWVGPDGKILWANRAELEMLGYAAEEYIGRDIRQFHVDAPVIDDILCRLTQGQVLQAYGARLRRKDGSIAEVLIDSSVYFEGDQFVHTRCFTRDVTALKRAEREREQLLEAERAARAEAERASRIKDEFLATLSHELRTPLNAIMGWSQLLRSGAATPEDLAQGLEVIQRNCRAQTQLIEDLLDMSRVVTGKLRLDMRPVDLAAVVGAAVDAVRPAAEAKGLRVELDVDPLAPPVRGDAARLQQVIWNLLTNAIKFTPAGGAVRAALERADSHVEVVVSDTGAGIPPEFLPHVFERFRQADGSITRRHGGLGLGLAIVKQLAELHGGTVRAKSAGEGHGATFAMSLPGLPPEEPHAATGSGRDNPCDRTDLTGVRVLVVDDEPDAREVVKRLLGECGAAVTTACSAEEALDALRRERPDVLVSDIGMPGVDGYELLRRVRALGRDRGGDVPAVALTAFARPDDRLRALRAGYQLHLAKPVDVPELYAVVASVAGRLSPSGSARL